MIKLYKIACEACDNMIQSLPLTAYGNVKVSEPLPQAGRHLAKDHDRSTPDATHAWVDVLLPQLGWVGFDPTNNLVAHHRHIRTAVGRDYADVPPTHGVFRGSTDSELYVAVHVEASAEPPALDRKLPIPEDWSVLVERAQQPQVSPIPFIDLQQMQQQQQQQ